MFMPAVTISLWLASADPLPSKMTFDPKEAQLGTAITVTVVNPPKRDSAPPSASILPKWILYCDGIPLKGIYSESPDFRLTADNQGQLTFRLDRTKESQESWLTLVKSASFERDVVLQLGSEKGIDQSIAAAEEKLKIVLRPTTNLTFAAFGVILLLIVLFFLAKNNPLLRTGGSGKAGDPLGSYSLGLTQMAFWFFLIFVAYIYIGIVTWNFSDSISTSVLVLMGISGGTALGAISIDNDKRQRRNTLVSEQSGLKAEVAALERQIGAATGELKSLLTEKKNKLEAEAAILTAQIGAAVDDPKPALIEQKTQLGNRVAELEAQIATASATGDLRAELNEEKRRLDVEVAALTKRIVEETAAAEVLKASLVEKKRNLETEVAALATRIGTAPDELKQSLAEEKNKKSQRLAEIGVNLKGLPDPEAEKKSEGFFTDLLSDEVGISLHRFQIVCWTLVLGFVFISEVIRNLAMPVFSETLLTLMGISSGTYLGFKFPENKT